MSTKKLESVAGSKIIDWREGLEELLNQLEPR
jgi:dTDP-4-dehydrorhamnose reductase